MLPDRRINADNSSSSSSNNKDSAICTDDANDDWSYHEGTKLQNGGSAVGASGVGTGGIEMVLTFLREMVKFHVRFSRSVYIYIGDI